MRRIDFINTGDEILDFLLEKLQRLTLEIENKRILKKDYKEEYKTARILKELIDYYLQLKEKFEQKLKRR